MACVARAHTLLHQVSPPRRKASAEVHRRCGGKLSAAVGATVVDVVLVVGYVFGAHLLSVAPVMRIAVSQVQH